jgi:hypothetical protein
VEKQVIDSILLANSYLISCKMRDCSKSELARKYLVSKIEKALLEKRKSTSKKPSSFMNFFGYIFN